MEATKHRQAKEIKDLRRRLRESQFIFPSHLSQASKERYRSDTIQSGEQDNGEDDEDSYNGIENEKDAFERIKLLLETLLDTGRQALKHGTDGIHILDDAMVLHESETHSRKDRNIIDLCTPSSTADIEAVKLSPKTNIPEVTTSTYE